MKEKDYKKTNRICEKCGKTTEQENCCGIKTHKLTWGTLIKYGLK